ncbi:MAG: hypothetical protein ABW152_01455 [Candidatus Thiodiazotropha endolucinida]
MAKVIVGIHGLANKPKKDVLKEWWRESIHEGLKKNQKINSPEFEFYLVHWADLLYKYPLHDEKNFSFDKLFNDEPYVKATEGALKKYDDDFLAKVRAGVFDFIGDTADALKVYAGMDSFADFLIGRLLKDLDFYYDNRKIQDRSGGLGDTQEVLRQELSDTLIPLKGESIMLISHSMGSIIAYDALRDLGRSDPGFELSHFVTIGSPLGLPHVKAKIVKERTYDEKVRTPSVVKKSWVNFADKKDPVAADVFLRGDYTANASGVEVVDDLVANDYIAPDKKKHNHHKSYGYLRTPEMSAHVAKFLGSL